VRGGRRWKLGREKRGSCDRSGSGSGLEDNNNREGYINSVMVRVINDGEG
jgi:hypothetical protein